ncbi:response regulator [Paenibacillus sp. NFR01]|uniref:response regulator n=1 Tax=Paenibacillus sp. NFR01 TaxID=1566279 RepID=UPI0008C6D16D|nr:response regulator [Paenibacillus sp. NFR01]SEU25802.1 two-component system, response regulator YesN [Paenibacillus sp. NFR01]
MKVLIVDDEKHVRDAIRYFVPWEKHQITEIFEADSGREAMEIMRAAQPEIVFTDMRMPLVDGAELLEWLHNHYPHTKTIVISGYQDFHYVKPAIRFGGTDYLLKPINSKQLVAAAEHAFQLWRDEEAERLQAARQNMQLNVLRPLYWDKALSDLVSGHASFAELRPAMREELGLPEQAARCVVGVMTLQGSGCRLVQRFGGDVLLTSFVMANVCNEVLSERGGGYAFRSWQPGADITLLFWSPEESQEETQENVREHAQEKAKQINQALRQAYGIEVDIGLSRPHALAGGLQPAFREACRGLSERNLLHAAGRIYPFRDAQQAPEDEVPDLPALLDKLSLAVLSGDGDKMERAVDEWAARLAGLPLLTESGFRHMQAELRTVLQRWRPEEDIVLEPCLNSEGGFAPESWSRQLKALLRRLAQGSAQTPDSKLIQEIKEYLEQNYSRELTLQHIAERFFVSRENVSRKFKQITGENLSDYLTGLRVGKAKALLQNTALRLSQISELVGYEDEKYFSRVFKKATGLTPREYRKLTGQDGER